MEELADIGRFEGVVGSSPGLESGRVRAPFREDTRCYQYGGNGLVAVGGTVLPQGRWKKNDPLSQEQYREDVAKVSVVLVSDAVAKGMQPQHMTK